MKTYLITIKHDNGTLAVQTTATDRYAAISNVMQSEGCPRSAIESAKKINERKTEDYFLLLANYGQGWEEETEEKSKKELRERIKEYRSAAPQYQYKMKFGRRKIKA